MDELVTVSEAGRILKRCGKTVREYDRIGKLKAYHTQRGWRLFLVADVERLAREIQQESRKKENE